MNGQGQNPTSVSIIQEQCECENGICSHLTGKCICLPGWIGKTCNDSKILEIHIMISTYLRLYCPVSYDACRSHTFVWCTCCYIFFISQSSNATDRYLDMFVYYRIEFIKIVWFFLYFRTYLYSIHGFYVRNVFILTTCLNHAVRCLLFFRVNT